MRKYISIVELFARSTIYQVFFVLLGMSMAEIFAFSKGLERWGETAVAEVQADIQIVSHYSLEWMIERGYGMECLAVAFLLLTIILCLNCCGSGSKSIYTIQRLQVTEKKIFVIQSLYNSFCYCILLGTQAAVFLVECSMYQKQFETITNQTIFLAFYRNALMHSVLPLEDVGRWILNILMVIGCGAAAAQFSYCKRRGKMAWSMLFVTAFLVLVFVQNLGNATGLLLIGIVCVVIGVGSFWQVLRPFNEE